MIGELLALLGAALVLLASIGVLRFDEPLARMHALAKASTLGILLVLAGAAVNLHTVNDITSVVLAALLHVLVSPPASNMVSRATYLVTGLPLGDATVDEASSPSDCAAPTRKARRGDRIDMIWFSHRRRSGATDLYRRSAGRR